MNCWTFDKLKKDAPHIYPEEKKFWFPLYILQDHLVGVKAHTHKFVEIAVVHYGSARHTRFFPDEVKKKKNLISAGDIFGFLPGEYHEISRTSEEWCLFDILFDPAVLGEDWDKLIRMPGLDILLNQKETLHLSPSCFENITEAIFYLQQEFFQHGNGYEMNLRGLLLDLLIRIGRSPIQTENLKTNTYTDKAIQYIRHHASEKINLDDIAKYAGVNKTYLCHLFQVKMGMKLWDFLNQVRIEQAKFYFQTINNAQICEIAALCGFENNSYFAKIFRKQEGISPCMYLKKMKKR